MSATGAPVFGKVPVDTIGCVPLPELDDMVAFGAALVSVVGGVALSDVVVGVEVVDVELGDEGAGGGGLVV